MNDEQSPGLTPRDEVASLLRRYPSLSETELTRLISAYRKLSALDMALMLSDEELGPRLHRFSAEHRSVLRTPFRHYAALVLYAILAVVAVAWAASAAAA